MSEYILLIYASDLRANKRSPVADVALGLPSVPDFPGCTGLAPGCPASLQDQPRDAKCPGFQDAVKITIIRK